MDALRPRHTLLLRMYDGLFKQRIDCNLLHHIYSDRHTSGDKAFDQLMQITKQAFTITMSLGVESQLV